MLQNGLYPNDIDALIDQRDIVRIGKEIDIRAIIDVKCKRVHTRIGREVFDAWPDCATADD